jgi:hypothetical protein
LIFAKNFVRAAFFARMDHREQGNAYFKAGNFLDALNCYSLGIQEDPLNRKEKAEFFANFNGDWQKLKKRNGLILEKLQVLAISTSEYDCASSTLSGDLKPIEDGNLAMFMQDKSTRVHRIF